MRFASFIVILGTVASLWFYGSSAENMERVIEFRAGAYFSAAILSTITFASVLAHWFIPFGRRPHEIPAWNDLHHRPRQRSLRALRGAVGAMVICAIGAFMLAPFVTTSLGGQLRTAEAEVQDVHVPARRLHRCSLRVTLRTATESGQICACKLQRCLGESVRALTSGQRVIVTLRDNLFGTVVDGIEAA
jgi:hypothetical protein